MFDEELLFSEKSLRGAIGGQIKGYDHVMIDIESLGIAPKGAITQISALEFDLATGKVGARFDHKIDIEQVLEIGMEVNADTLRWWADQNSEVYKRIISGTKDLKYVLKMFDSFIHELGGNQVKIWANPPAFDVVIIESAYRLMGVNEKELSWRYWNQRDVGTYVSFFPDFKWDLKDKYEAKEAFDAHNALHDCYFQVDLVSQIHNKITKNEDTP